MITEEEIKTIQEKILKYKGIKRTTELTVALDGKILFPTLYSLTSGKTRITARSSLNTLNVLKEFFIVKEM